MWEEKKAIFLQNTSWNIRVIWELVYNFVRQEKDQENREPEKQKIMAEKLNLTDTLKKYFGFDT